MQSVSRSFTSSANRISLSFSNHPGLPGCLTVIVQSHRPSIISKHSQRDLETFTSPAAVGYYHSICLYSGVGFQGIKLTEAIMVLIAKQ